MTRDDKEIVSALQRAMIGRVGKDLYHIWFDEAVTWQLRGNQLYLHVENLFSLERMQRQFRSQLCLAIAEVAESADVQLDTDPVIRMSSTPQPKAKPKTKSKPPTENGQKTNGKRRKPKAPNANQGQLPFGTSANQFRFSTVTFDTFATGNCNQLALTAAKEVAQRPGLASPLYIYGPSGCGKTHLLHAIRNQAKANGARRAIYLSSEEFTCQFLAALQSTGLPSFRQKYRDVDYLLLDDVRFFRGKRATLNEFHHTLDTLQQRGAQVVVTSDVPPNQLGSLGLELANRLAGGLVCSLQPPDAQARHSILKSLAEVHDVPLSSNMLESIAERGPADGRRLQGIIHRLRAVSAISETPLSIEDAINSLSDLLVSSHRLVQMPEIEQAVCEAFGLQHDSLNSSSRTKAISQPRMLAMWLARRYTSAAYSEIGKHFGNRAHSTAISAEKKVNHWLQSNAKISLPTGNCPVAEALQKIEAQLEQGQRKLG